MTEFSVTPKLEFCTPVGVLYSNFLLSDSNFFVMFLLCCIVKLPTFSERSNIAPIFKILVRTLHETTVNVLKF